MKMKELETAVKAELDEEKAEVLKRYLRERYQEVQSAKLVFEKLEREYVNLLYRDVDDLYLDLKSNPARGGCVTADWGRLTLLKDEQWNLSR